MSPTPYRYSEKSVLRYIMVIKDIAYHAVPTRLEFNPTPLGVGSETAACRLRDAVHSLCTGLTSHPSIDPTLLAERYRHYRVSHDGTKVFVVPKTEKKQSTSAQVEVSQPTTNDMLARVKSTDTAVLSAFALLLGRHFLEGRVEIVGEITDLSFLAQLQQNDIVIDTISPNLHIMF